MNQIFNVRRGFLLGAMAGFSIAGSLLWAIPAVTPYLPHQFQEPKILSDPSFPIARGPVPPELSWFFIQYPYVSDRARIQAKTHHAFVIDDPVRRRNYVVNVGQKVRRVEIYAADSNESQIHVFTPGTKRTVKFSGERIIGQFTAPDGNLWMWKSPLWNAQHLRIYSLADLWLDSPYKRYSCAGFVHRFLQDVDVRVPAMDAWDMARLPWVHVSLEELEPGDIITMKAASARHQQFWGHRITHVGVYIGNGKFIHAATASRRARRSFVRVADLRDFHSRIDKILRPPELL